MQEKSLIKQNILQFLDFKGISKYKFYQETGISRNTLDQNNGMSEDNTARFLAYFPEVNAEWLLTGQGSMLKTDTYNNSDTYNNVSVTIEAEDSDTKAVYLYDVPAAAGLGNFESIITSDNIIGKYVIPEFKNVDFMIYVKRSSMYPKYSSGDIIACRVLHESRFMQWGKVYILATTEQGLLVKRIKKSEKEDCLLAVSDNKDYEPFDIPIDEICGLALVVGVIRME